MLILKFALLDNVDLLKFLEPLYVFATGLASVAILTYDFVAGVACPSGGGDDDDDETRKKKNKARAEFIKEYERKHNWYIQHVMPVALFIDLVGSAWQLEPWVTAGLFFCDLFGTKPY